MICRPCRADSHQDCPEVARQFTGWLSLAPAVELTGGQMCECQHRPRPRATTQEGRP